MTPVQSLLAYWLKPEGECLVYTGALARGYGTVHCSGGTFRAHRVAYEWWVGPIPEGLTIDHLCRNRACCWPPHLEAVTMTVNVMRGESPPARNARQVNCIKGHPLSGSNLVIQVRGNGRKQRDCRECSRIATREAMRRQYRKNIEAGLTASGAPRKRAVR